MISVLNKILSKTSREARYLRGNARHFMGMDAAHFAKARGNRMLVYHGICQKDPLKYNTLFITQKTFEQHLQYYQRYFNVVSLDDYFGRRFSSTKFNICLTFDDGFANNYHYALPLLEQYKIPVTFFVTAIRAAGYDILWNDHLSIAGKYGPPALDFRGERYFKNRYRKYVDARGQSLNDKLRQTGFAEKAELMRLLDKLVPFRSKALDTDYWLQMTPGQIQAASTSPYITIGSHGYYHNDLAGIPAEDAVKELTASKHYLESLTGKPINSLAFPYGSYPEKNLHLFKTIGYAQLLATDLNGNQADSAMWERLTINPFVSITNQMNANIKGSY